MSVKKTLLLLVLCAALCCPAFAVTVRGSNIQSSSASSYTVSWPSGTVAGDLAVVFVGSAYAVNNPSGWTVLDSTTGANFQGSTFSKYLTSGDISTGSVTITMAGAFNSVLTCITFVGGSVRPVEVRSVQNSGSASPVADGTSGAPVIGDTVLMWGSARAGVNVTANLGSSQQATNASNASGALYLATLASSGTVSASYSFSAGVTGFYVSTVVLTPWGATANPVASAFAY